MSRDGVCKASGSADDCECYGCKDFSSSATPKAVKADGSCGEGNTLDDGVTLANCDPFRYALIAI